MKEKYPRDWWLPREQGGFFGKEYMNGDDSEEGPYCDKPMTLAQRTEREIASLISLLKLTPDHLVLDCPSGYCRHALGLARRGIKVIAVDFNPDYLRRAALTVKDEGIPDSLIEIRQGDMRHIPVQSDHIDVGINMFTSSGFFEEDEDNIQVFREFHRVLKPGGQFLIHLDYNLNRVRTGRWQYENRNRQLKGNAKLLVDERYDDDAKRIVGSWTVVDDSEEPNYVSHYSLRVFSPDEYKAILADCGFTEITILGDFEEPFGELTDESLETVIKAVKL